MTEKFDPRSVPPFPIVNITLLEDDSATVDGRPVDIGMDQSPKDAAMQAAIVRSVELGLDSVRVRAIGPDGTHLMVVTADGEVFSLGEERQGNATGRAPRKGLTLALAGVIALTLTGAGITAFAVASSAPAPTPTAYKTPGAEANVPVVAPPGYAQAATWSIQVDAHVDPILVTPDQIALVNGDSRLQIRDVTNGKTIWQAQGRQNIRGGIHSTTVAGVPVLATDSSGELTVWPLENNDEGVVSGVSYPAGSGAEVTYLGSTPLIDLGDQTVAVVTSDGIAQLDVPVTATAVLATSEDVVAFSDTSIWHIPFIGEPSEQLIPTPEGAVGPPLGVTAADDTHMVFVWGTATQTVRVAALVDADTGTVLATAQISSRAVSSQDVPAHSVDAETMIVGGLFIDYGDVPALIELEGITAQTVNGNTVYGVADSRTVSATRAEGTFTVAPFSTSSVADNTLPIAATNSYAFVVSQKVGQDLLYTLPRQD